MKLTPELIKKYNINGPRYTSYPTAPNWSDSISQDHYTTHLTTLKNTHSPLSLYIHIPFCEKQCYFCGCNVIIKKKKQSFGDTYLDYIEKECQLITSSLGQNHPVQQLHIGGGTPTYLSDTQLLHLHTILTTAFDCSAINEYSIEIDPRLFDSTRLPTLQKMGINRLSFGIQDFDKSVQDAINRHYESTDFAQLLSETRKLSFSSINADLIYGLPFQTPQKFQKTIETITDLKPDRIALYSFAYLPQLISHHRLINKKNLPSPDQKIELYLNAQTAFENAGYHSIAMDHFALKSDDLAIAYDQGTMARNFMGYTTLATENYLGLGVSAIGYAHHAFFQNTKDLSIYYSQLDTHQLPTHRGSLLTKDDLIRQWVIFELMCKFKCDKSEFRQKFNTDFDTYFNKEHAHLTHCDSEKLLTNGPVITISELGKLFIRNVCMGFDAYLIDTKLATFSKTI
jgi:oxygen-independent coproporphyrinogen-3 oxidase